MLLGLSKFVLGVTLAIALLFFTGVTASRYMMMRLSSPPPRPVFPNDSPSPTPTPAAAAAASPAAAAPPPEASPAAASPSPEAPAADGYTAKVNQPVGLILRQEASRESAQVAGLQYNQEVVVLETSPDGEWLRVRVPDNGLEGWIKSGNTDRVN